MGRENWEQTLPFADTVPQGLEAPDLFQDLRGADETVSQLLFRTFGACPSTTFYPRLAPWAALLRRFAARIVTRGPLFVQFGGCDTVSQAPLFHGSASIRDSFRLAPSRRAFDPDGLAFGTAESRALPR